MGKSKYRYTCERHRITFVGSVYGRVAYFFHRLFCHYPRITITVDRGDGWLKQDKNGVERLKRLKKQGERVE